MSGVCYGIDLGTTNTVVTKGVMGINGFFNAHVIDIIQYDENKNIRSERFLPSVIYLDENNREYVGMIGKNLRTQAYKKTLSNTKRYMGTSKTMKIGDKEYQAKDVARAILNVCKVSMMRYSNKKEIVNVTVTVPASFNVDAIRDTKEAALSVGFKNVTVIPEPTAALIDFINGQSVVQENLREIDFSEKKRILVFDLGGGTLDIAVVDVSQNGRNVEFTEIAIGRYDELGGIDFDSKAAMYMLNKFANENRVDIEKVPIDKREKMINDVRIFCEKAKEWISSELELGFSDEPEYRQYLINFYENKNVEMNLSKKEYDIATQSFYKKAPRIKDYKDTIRYKNIVDPIISTLKEYNIKKDSIDLVFLTGGMSQYKTVKEKVAEIIELKDQKIISSPYPMESVSRGAAIYGYYDTVINELEKNSIKEKEIVPYEENALLNTSISVRKVLAEAIMIDVTEGLPVTIINANKEIPCEGVLEGKLRTTSPSGIMVNLYAGIDEFDWKMRLQRTQKAYFKKPIKTNTPIDIHYSIDKNKYLSLFVLVQGEQIALEQELDAKVKEI